MDNVSPFVTQALDVSAFSFFSHTLSGPPRCQGVNSGANIWEGRLAAAISYQGKSSLAMCSSLHPE
eukprot:c2570_g1_i1 orf=105-302(-)